MALATAPVAAGSMFGSYVIASRVGSRTGAVVTMAGALGWCTAAWKRDHGTTTAAALVGVYLAGFGVSHPLARRVGAWPAVTGMTALTGLASYVAADRRSRS